MAMFAAVAPGGKVRHAIRGARVDEHIPTGYHADARAADSALCLSPGRHSSRMTQRAFWTRYNAAA